MNERISGESIQQRPGAIPAPVQQRTAPQTTEIGRPGQVAAPAAGTPEVRNSDLNISDASLQGEPLGLNDLPLYCPPANIKLALAYAGWKDVSGGYDKIAREGQVTPGLSPRDIEGIIEVFGQGSYELQPAFTLTQEKKEILRSAVRTEGLTTEEKAALLALSEPMTRPLTPQGFETLKGLVDKTWGDNPAGGVLKELAANMKQKKDGLSAEKVEDLKKLADLMRSNPKKYGNNIYLLDPISEGDENDEAYNSAMKVLADINMQIGLVSGLDNTMSLFASSAEIFKRGFDAGMEMSLASIVDMPKITGVDNNILSVFKIALNPGRLESMSQAAEAHRLFSEGDKEIPGVERKNIGFEGILKKIPDIEESKRFSGTKAINDELIKHMCQCGLTENTGINPQKKAEFEAELKKLEESAASAESLEEAQKVNDALVVLGDRIAGFLREKAINDLMFLTDSNVEAGFVAEMAAKAKRPLTEGDFIGAALGNLTELGINTVDSQGNRITNCAEFVDRILKRDGGWNSLSVTVGEDPDTTLAKMMLATYIRTAQTEESGIPVAATLAALTPVIGNLAKFTAGPVVGRGIDLKINYGPDSAEQLMSCRGRLNRLAQAVGMNFNADTENLSMHWYLALLTAHKDPGGELAARFSSQDALEAYNSIDAKTLEQIIIFLEDAQRTFTQSDYSETVKQLQSEGRIFFDPAEYGEWIPKLKTMLEDMQKTGDISVIYGPGAGKRLKGLPENTKECIAFLGQSLIDIYTIYGEGGRQMAHDYKEEPFKFMDLGRLEFVDRDKTKAKQSLSVVPDSEGIGYQDPYGYWDTAVGVLYRNPARLAYDAVVGGSVEAAKSAYRIATIPPNIMMMFGNMCYSAGDWMSTWATYDPNDKTSMLNYRQKTQMLMSTLGQVTGMLGRYSYDFRVWGTELLNILKKEPEEITDEDISRLAGSLYVFGPFAWHIAQRTYGMGRQMARSAAGLDGIRTDWGMAGAPFKSLQNGIDAIRRSGKFQDFSETRLGSAGKWIADHIDSASVGLRKTRGAVSGPVDDFIDLKWESITSPLRSGVWSLQDKIRGLGDLVHEKSGRLAPVPDALRFVYSDLLRTKTSSQVWGKYYTACGKLRGKIFEIADNRARGRTAEEVAEINKNSVYFYGEKVVFLEPDTENPGKTKVMKREDAQKYLMMVDSALSGEVIDRKAKEDVARFDSITIDRYLDAYLRDNPIALQNAFKLVKQAEPDLSDRQALGKARSLLRNSLEDDIRKTMMEVMMGEAQRPLRIPTQATEDLKYDVGLGHRAAAERLQRDLLELQKKGQGITAQDADAMQQRLEKLLKKMTGSEIWANVYQEAMKNATAPYGNTPQDKVSAMLGTVSEIAQDIERFSKMTGRDRLMMVFTEERLTLLRDIAAWKKHGVSEGEIQGRVLKRVEDAVSRLGGSVEDTMADLRLELRKYGTQELVSRLGSEVHGQTTVEMDSEGRISRLSGNLSRYDPALGQFIKENSQWFKENGITEIRVPVRTDGEEVIFEVQRTGQEQDSGKVLVINGSLSQARGNQTTAMDAANRRLDTAETQRASASGGQTKSLDDLRAFMQGKATNPEEAMAPRTPLPGNISGPAKIAVDATGGREAVNAETGERTGGVGTLGANVVTKNSLVQEWTSIRARLEAGAAQRQQAILEGRHPEPVDEKLMQDYMAFARKATWFIFQNPPNGEAPKSISLNQAQLEAIFMPVRNGNLESIATLSAGYGKSLPEAWRAFLDHVSTGLPVRATSYTDPLVEQLHKDVFTRLGAFLGIEVGKIDETIRYDTARQVQELNKPVVLETEASRAFREVGNLLTHIPIGPSVYLRVTDESHMAKGQNYTIQMIGEGGDTALSPIRDAIKIALGLDDSDYVIKDKVRQDVELTDSGKAKLASLTAVQRERVITALKLEKCMGIGIDFVVDEKGGVYILMEKGVPAPGKVLNDEQHLVMSLLRGTTLSSTTSESFQFNSHTLRMLDEANHRFSSSFTATSGREHSTGTEVFKLTTPPIGEETSKGIWLAKDMETRDNYVIDQLVNDLNEEKVVFEAKNTGEAYKPKPKLVFFQNDAEAKAFQDKMIRSSGVNPGLIQMISAEELLKMLKAQGKENSELARMVDDMVKAAAGKGVTIGTLMIGVGSDFSQVDRGYLCLAADVSLETQLRGRWGGFRSYGTNVQFQQVISLETGSDGKPVDRFLAENSDDHVEVLRQQAAGRIVNIEEPQNKLLLDYYRHLQWKCEDEFRKEYKYEEQRSQSIFDYMQRPFIELGENVQQARATAQSGDPNKAVAEVNWLFIEQVLRNAGVEEAKLGTLKNQYITAAETALDKKPAVLDSLQKRIFESLNKQYSFMTKRNNALAGNSFPHLEIAATMQQASGRFLRGIIPKLPVPDVMDGIKVSFTDDEGKTTEYTLSKVIDDYTGKKSKVPLTLFSTRPQQPGAQQQAQGQGGTRQSAGDDQERMRLAAGGAEEGAQDEGSVDEQKVSAALSEVMLAKGAGMLMPGDIDAIARRYNLNPMETQRLKELGRDGGIRGAQSGRITPEQAAALGRAAVAPPDDPASKIARQAFLLFTGPETSFMDPATSAKIGTVTVVEDAEFTRLKLEGSAFFVKGADGKYTIYIKRSACGDASKPLDPATHRELFKAQAHELAEIQMTEKDPGLDPEARQTAAHMVAEVTVNALMGDDKKTAADKLADLSSKIRTSSIDASAAGQRSVDVGAKMGFGMSLIIYNLVPELWKNGLKNINTTDYWAGSIGQSWQAARRGAFYALRDNFIQDYFSAVLCGTNYTNLDVWERTSFSRKAGFTVLNFGAMAVSGVFDDAIIWARENTHYLESKNPYEREYYYKMMTEKIVQGSVSNMAFELPGLLMAAGLGKKIPAPLQQPLRTALGVATNMTARKLFDMFAFDKIQKEYLGDGGKIKQYEKGFIQYEEDLNSMQSMASWIFYSPDFISGAGEVSDMLSTSMDINILSGLGSRAAGRVIPRSVLNWTAPGGEAAVRQMITVKAQQLAAKAGSDNVQAFMAKATRSVTSRAALAHLATVAFSAKAGWDRASAAPAGWKNEEMLDYGKSLGLSVLEGGFYGGTTGLLLYGLGTAALYSTGIGIIAAELAFTARRVKEFWDIKAETQADDFRTSIAIMDKNLLSGLRYGQLGWVAGLSAGDIRGGMSIEQLREMYPFFSDRQLQEFRTASSLSFHTPLTAYAGEKPYNDFELIETYFGSGEWKQEKAAKPDSAYITPFSCASGVQGPENQVYGPAGAQLTSLGKNGMLSVFYTEKEFLDAYLPNWRHLAYREAVLKDLPDAHSFSRRLPKLFNCATVQSFIADVRRSGLVPRDISAEYVRDPKLLDRLAPEKFWSEGDYEEYLSQEELLLAETETQETRERFIDFVNNNISEGSRDAIINQQQAGPIELYAHEAMNNYLSLENKAFTSGQRPAELEGVQIPDFLRLELLDTLPNIRSQIWAILTENGSLQRACFKRGIEQVFDVEKASPEKRKAVFAEALQDTLGAQSPVTVLGPDQLTILSKAWAAIQKTRGSAQSLTLAALSDPAQNLSKIPLSNIREYPALYEELVGVLKKTSSLRWALKDCGHSESADLKALTNIQLNDVLTLALGRLLTANKVAVERADRGVKAALSRAVGLSNEQYVLPFVTPEMASVLAKPKYAYFDTRSVSVTPMLTP